MSRRYREIYGEMTEEQKKVIDGIYDVVNEYCRKEGIKIVGDDRAEMFVGAITKYILTSKED